MKINFSQPDHTSIKWEAVFPCGREISITIRSIYIGQDEAGLGTDWITPDGALADEHYREYAAKQLPKTVHELTADHPELAVAGVYDPYHLMPFPSGPTWTSYFYAMHWSAAIVFARQCIETAHAATKNTTPSDGIH